MIRILASTSHKREFDVADAIAALGGYPIAPRTVEEARDKDRKHVLKELPVLPGYLFIALRPNLWHTIKDGVRIKSGRLVPVYRQADIGPKEWSRVQDFAARVEADYQHRMAMLQEGPRQYVAPYRVEERLHILGGDLEARFKRSLGTTDAPMIEAELTMFGREITVKLHPDAVGKPI